MKYNEIVREAEYTDVILSLLSEPYQILSVTKMIFISFCVMHENNLKAYATRKKDFADIFFENISFKLDKDYKDVEKILHILDILVKTKKIIIIDDRIELLETIKHSTENKFINMCTKKVPNPILEITKLDSVAVLEEVIRYV
jgi:ABC-type uncharacterized transport system substrate-binding protein